MPLFNTNTVAITSSGTATPTTVTAATTSTSILAANSSRKGATILNNGTANLYLELGATASLTGYTVKINSGGYYELPFGYTGQISGIWDAVSGNALVRELI